MKNFFKLLVIVGPLPNTISNGQLEDAVPVMANFNWIINQVNANAQASGLVALLNAANTFTQVQSGIAATSPANFPIASQVQDSVFTTLSSTLGTNTLTSRIAALALGAYTSGQVFSFIPSQTNTGAASMNIDGVGARTLLNMTSNLTGTELRQAVPVLVKDDGANLNILNGPRDVQGPTIVAAATLNLDTVFGDYHHVSGTTAVTAVTLSRGRQKVAVFDSSPVFTNGASLLLIGAANRTPVSGDASVLRGEASGVVREVAAAKASGRSIAPSRQLLYSAVQSSVAQVDVPITGSFDIYELEIVNLTVGTDASQLQMRVTTDNFSTVKSGVGDYQWTMNGNSSVGGAGTLDASSGGTIAQINLTSSASGIDNGSATSSYSGRVIMWAPSSAVFHKRFKFFAVYNDNEAGTSPQADITGGGAYIGSATAINGVRLFPSAGNISFTLRLYGIAQTV